MPCASEPDEKSNKRPLAQLANLELHCTACGTDLTLAPVSSHLSPSSTGIITFTRRCIHPGLRIPRPRTTAPALLSPALFCNQHIIALLSPQSRRQRPDRPGPLPIFHLTAPFPLVDASLSIPPRPRLRYGYPTLLLTLARTYARAGHGHSTIPTRPRLVVRSISSPTAPTVNYRCVRPSIRRFSCCCLGRSICFLSTAPAARE